MNNVIIVGGGTAGWLTALYAQMQLNLFGKTAEITVIDSTEVGIVGVGEATVHSIRYFLQQLRIDEAEFMAATDATFKLGIRFDNWRQPVNGEQHSYWHPFDSQLLTHKGFDIAQLWDVYRRFDTNIDFADVISISPYLAKLQRSPKQSGGKPYDSPIPYAYHFDAGKAADFFKKVALQRGVKHICETVTEVEIEQQSIKSISTSSGHHRADFFFDCSGFHQLLIGRLTDENWHSYEDDLPCNRAVAVQTSYLADEKPNLFTTSTALSHGWAWQIHLTQRKGNGYVYDGNRLTPEQAERELKEFIGAPEDAPSKHLKMNIGRCKSSWIGNCLAIGLSSGFIEPLESTGIYLIEAALRRAFELGLDIGSACDTNLQQRQEFNHFLANLYDELRDFIVLHYCLTDRQDTEFWRHFGNGAGVSTRLNSILQRAKSRVINDKDLGSNLCLFNQINYRFVLFGMGYLPDAVHPQLQLVSKNELEPLFNQLLSFYQNQSQQHPTFPGR